MDTKDTELQETRIFFHPHRTFRRGNDGGIGMDETFYINSDLPESAKDNILHCFAFGVSRWGANWCIKKEYGRYISFNFILEGSTIIQTRDQTVTLKPGDLLIARRTPLLMRTPPGGMTRKYCLLLSNTLIQSAICDFLSPADPGVLHISKPEKLTGVLEEIGNGIKNGLSRRKLDMLIFEFLQELREERSRQGEFPPLLEKALAILRKNDFRISRFELSRQCNVSPRTLSRLFAKSLNTSPGQYIIRCRLEKAANMLSLSSEPIKNIASECGFSSPMFFAREFRQHYQCTPTAFRKQRRK